MATDSVVFDRAADYYDATRGFPPEEVPAIVALFLSTGALTPATGALEVGVGTGRLALPLAPHVRRLVGIDLSRPMLQRLRAKQAGEPIVVLEGDATALPLASASIDTAIAAHIFHLIAAWQTALAEVARVLRPGGVLIAGGADHGGGPRLDQELREIWREAAGEHETRNVGVPREQQDTFLQEAGWHPLGERRTHTYSITRPLREVVARIEQRVWSGLWRASDEAHARGVSAVHAAIAARGLDLDTSITHVSGFSLQVFAPPARHFGL